MTLSKETALQVVFPVIPTTPVQVMTEMTYQVGERKMKQVPMALEESPSTLLTLKDIENHSPDASFSGSELMTSEDGSDLVLQAPGLMPVCKGLQCLKKTSVGFLITKTPIK